MARVFDTDSYIFATTGLAGLSSAKYEVAADKTLFVRPTHLFKSDLKMLNPKAGSKVSAQGLELKWQEYPDAAYYKLSLYPSELVRHLALHRPARRGDDLPRRQAAPEGRVPRPARSLQRLRPEARRERQGHQVHRHRVKDE